MKEKILAQLKIKFPNLGFTDKAFEGVAAYLATTVTEEANIETALSSGVDALLKAFQGDADSRVNTAIEKTKKELTPAGPKVEKEEPIIPANETPSEKLLRETLAAIVDNNAKLAERLEKIETGGVAVNRKTTLEAALANVPEAQKKSILEQFEVVSPLAKDEATYNAWIEKVASKEILDGYIQAESTKGVKSIGATLIGSTKVTDGKSTTFADTLKGAVDSKIEADEKKVVKN